MLPDITVVIPTIREECAVKWVEQWKDDLKDARIIIVEDNPERSFRLSGVEHYAWRDIDQDLGRDKWIIPRRTSACRSYGFLKALEGPSDIIWTTDDDCYPEDDRRGSYTTLLTGVLSDVYPDESWWNTIRDTGLYPRGYPYEMRDSLHPVMVHHGLWSNIPDLDGVTQLANPDYRTSPVQRVERIPQGKLFPMCIMNVAFRREMTPAMYMLLMGQDHHGKKWGFDRFDDIWAGLFVKRIADHLGYAVTSGGPSVHHSRASDPHRNVELEAAGMAAHEDFWKFVDCIPLTKSTVAECYIELADAIADYDGAGRLYWLNLSEAMEIFAERAANVL
jgi:reversibly glycosylated polypeptide/UDP-arabinopyranose mutase